jgi:hypothetical protein
MIRLALPIASLALFCSIASGAVVDQSNVVPPPAKSVPILAELDNAQVVTVGTGGVLSTVQLGLFREAEATAPLYVDITRVENQVPVFGATGRLATLTFEGSGVFKPTSLADYTVPTFNFTADFSLGGLVFQPGEQFAIVLRTDAAEGGYNWWLSDTDTYSGGASWQSHDGSPISKSPLGDLHFRTFVQAPEPTALALAALAFLFIRPRP